MTGPKNQVAENAANAATRGEQLPPAPVQDHSRDAAQIAADAHAEAKREIVKILESMARPGETLQQCGARMMREASAQAEVKMRERRTMTAKLNRPTYQKATRIGGPLKG